MTIVRCCTTVHDRFGGQRKRAEAGEVLAFNARRCCWGTSRTRKLACMCGSVDETDGNWGVDAQDEVRSREELYIEWILGMSKGRKIW